MQTIGILVDASVFRNIKSGKTGSEKIHLYNKASLKHGVIPIYFCLEHLSIKTRTGVGYKYVGGKFVRRKYTLPRVIHNRTLPASKRMRNRLKLLTRRCVVFNAKNRNPKYRIHKMLKGSFRTHLPVTSSYSLTRLQTMMKQHSSLYIKPQSSSVGKGIVKISRKSDGRWKLQFPRKRSILMRKPQAVKKISGYVKRKKYLIQQTIPLAQYKGKPYDIRVTVQRNASGAWQVTGMYGKVARRGSHLTNIAQRGTAKKCEMLFQSSFQNPSQVADDLKDLSLEIARHLGKKLKHLADLGLDMGVDASGKPYFIEMNGRDQRYGFKKAKMPTTFYRTYETPIAYAKHLLQGVKQAR